MDLNWFQTAPLPSDEIHGTYNYGLVALSYIIAVLASYVWLNFAGRLRVKKGIRYQVYWLLGGAVAMGAGIWSMHFIGMLAFTMPMPMGYESSWTISSLFTAIIASGLALYLLKNENRLTVHMIIGGIFIGLGISSMHYMGMMAMTPYITIRFLPGLFFLSILIGILAAEAALWLASRTSQYSFKHQFKFKILAALMMGLAICGMHYTGMAAAIFSPLLSDNNMLLPTVADSYRLAFSVTALTVFIIIIALAASIYSRKMDIAIQNEKKFLNAMINNLTDGILACDATGKITVCNHSLNKYVQIRKETSYFNLNKFFELKLPNAEFSLPIEQTPLYRAFHGENIRPKEYLLCYQPNNKRNVVIEGQPIINAHGEKLGAVIVLHDITDLKQTEKLKQEFISIVSHELRTPLTSILGSLSLLLGKIGGDLPEKMHNLLEIAKSNTERLIRLINDILDVEKIEAGKMDFSFRDFDISSLIREAIDDVKIIAENAQMQIVFDYIGEVMVHGDYDKLIQVMVNLLSNSIHFSKKGQSITVELIPSEDKTRVSIIDHGQGIPEAFRTKIFTKFSQADSSSSRIKGGTGLGLSICKSIIEKHGGTISFESIPNQITTFNFDLPKDLVKATKIIPQPEINNKAVPVLICDGNLDSATMLKEFLLTNNIPADIALSASKARELLKQKTYEVIAIDLVLQDYDGIRFVQELRQKEATATIPIMVISTLLSDEKKVINSCGFPIVDWLQKPLNEKQLKQFMEYLKTKFKTQAPHILCVEDDPDNSKVIQELLSDGAIVSTAFTIESARKKLNAHPYDLVVLDLKLPDGMGTDLLPCVNCKTNKVIPVVVFSAFELDTMYAPLIKQALLKSRVSNKELLAVLHSVLNKENEIA